MRTKINSKIYSVLTLALIFSALAIWSNANAYENNANESELYAANSKPFNHATYQEDGETDETSDVEEPMEPMPAPSDDEEVSVEE